MIIAAASDVLLAGACIIAMTLRVRRGPPSGRRMMLVGWIVLTAAAVCGALRYAVLADLVSMHRLLSDLAAGFGLPAVVLGLLLGWRASAAQLDGVLLTALAVIAAAAALADQVRLPGTVMTLLAALAAVLLAPREARAACVLGLVALLASAALATRLPQVTALAGLHVALAVAQLGWCRAALLPPRRPVAE
jgi:hypothetical protein